MRKRYLKIFENLEKYNELKDSIMGEPHVVLLDDTKEIIYKDVNREIDYSKEFFTIEALEDELTVQLSQNASEYRIDDGEWISLAANTATPPINSGQKISFKIANPTISPYVGIGTFTVSKSFNVEGNIMSLLYGDDFEGQIDLSGKNYAFYKLFQNCTTLQNVGNLILPSTTLASQCYANMFSNCTSLTEAPQLPATTLANYCYSYMFYGCTGLTSAPELPATTLASSCYSSMFSNCSNLTEAPQLPATTLASQCCHGMFSGCTSLVEAPQLPATTLANYCYQYMFKGCTSLTTAPSILPATTIASQCYQYMFQDCTSLVEAPQLPATTLASQCYDTMFSNCTSLTTAPQLPATTLANQCYWGMFNNTNVLPDCSNIDFSSESVVASGGLRGLFVGTKVTDADLERILPKNNKGKYCLPVTTLASACYQCMFSNCTNLVTAPELPATTLAGSCYSSMFKDCTSLTEAPELPATILTDWCYHQMFSGCTSLVEAPQLPATTLANYCYQCMFSNCTNLVTAPELPATTIAECCYYGMFQDCTSLTTAPELPATTLTKDSCYESMFYGCSKLNYIKMLARNIYATRCLSDWVNGVASSGTFVKNPDMTSLPNGISGIPEGWTVEGYDYSKEYFTIEALEDGLAVKLSQNTSEYRINGGNWISLTKDTATPSINKGQKISFKIANPTPTSSNGIGTFTVNKAFNVKGNIMSLLYGDSFKGQIDLSEKKSAFYKLFQNCTTLKNAENLILPSTTLVYGCYYNMFYGCTGLTSAPELPATTLAEGCYARMFYGCSSLTTAPALPATTLAMACYFYMFSGCSKLNKITMLATNIPAFQCLANWVSGVASSGTFGKHPNMKSLTSGISGIPTGWTVKDTFNNVSPCIINQVSKSITFVYSDGLFTPTNEIIDLSQHFTEDELLSIRPECDITVTLQDKTDNVLISNYAWTNDKTLGDVLNELGITKDVYDINVIIANANAPEDSGYYYYYMLDETEPFVEKDWMRIVSLEDGNNISVTKNVQYSINGTDWEKLNGNTITVNTNDIVYFKGTELQPQFTVSKKFNAEGNVMSLIFNNDFEGQIDLSEKKSAFNKLFQNCTTLQNAENLILPATTLAQSCYANMFNGCTSLTTAPQLPATTLANACYYGMFEGCKSLTTTPKLSATTLASNCYQYMFKGCTSLTTAPELLATSLQTNCYESMFYGCTGLTSAPQLPATTLASFCYLGMFRGCTSLTTAPKLSATTLAKYCYYGMFRGCTSLTTTLALPATTLAEWCYSYMFEGCTSLTTALALPATTLAKYCYQSMFEGCSKLNKIKMLATNISASYCLSNWVSGVASTGTFIKATSMTSLPSGSSGIPKGWTVEDFDYSKEFFTIEALEDGLTVQLSQNASEYRIDDGEWISLAANTATPPINSGQKISFKIANPTISSGVGVFTVNKAFNVEGNIMSLLYGDNFEGQIDLTGKNCSNLFRNCKTLRNAENLILPATTLASNCYHYMFYSCTSLTTAPSVLPATTLASNCYTGMFYKCTSLTTAPELPATTLADSCYYGMFEDCKSLTTTPKLSATTLAKYCYYGMFSGCTSLTTTLALPATTLAEWCYSYMFEGCTSLTTALALPATTLAKYCYYGMFYGCTSLTTAPTLPATRLENNCYGIMFKGCSKLNYIKMLATNISATDCLLNWVDGVASSGTFVKNAAKTLPYGVSGTPSGWTIKNA